MKGVLLCIGLSWLLIESLIFKERQRQSGVSSEGKDLPGEGTGNTSCEKQKSGNI